MYSLFLFLFVINAVILVIIVLMQSDKAGSLSGTFGGIGDVAGSAFGRRETAGFLDKLTIYMTTAFFILAILISVMSKSQYATKETPDSIIMQKGSSPVANLPGMDTKTLPKVDTKAVPRPVSGPVSKETKTGKK